MALLDEHIEGKYEIVGKLREGGMGAIYKVRHRLLDEIRVVKVIRSAVAGLPEAEERFLREARAAIRLRHPNIAVLHDFAAPGDGNAYIVMELIDGCTLQEILVGHGPLPLPLTVEIARQSLRALGYLHRQKIVHRDVSPDNLMLTRDVDGRPLVKLIDLGIAKAFEESAADLTSTGTFLGKPRYASPEQFSGAGLDARSDLYSFGIVLYELLTGRCPVHGNDPASYMAGHLLRPPLDFAESDPGGRVPPGLREIVLRALAKKPEERFADAEAFAWALTLIQDELPATGAVDLEAILRLPASPDEVAPLPPLPGSTQDRLDREFLMTETPSPAAGNETTASEATRRVSVPTSRLPDLPEPTRPLSLVPDVSAPTIASPAVPAATQAVPLRPVVPSGPSVLDDLTWVTSTSRRPEPPPEVPAAAPLAVSAGAQGVRSPWPRIAAGAGVALLLATGGGLWWMRSSSTSVDVPESVAIPTVEVSPAAATATAPQPAGTAPPEDLQPSAGTEEFQLSSQVPAPATPPAPEKPEKKTVLPEERAVPAADLVPMQRGDLIRRGMPNVEPPIPLDFPAYSYPAAAKGSGRKASVRVGVLVDENGRVVEAVVRSGGESVFGFNETALEAAWKAAFQPATRDDIPGRMWTELIFEFSE